MTEERYVTPPGLAEFVLNSTHGLHRGLLDFAACVARHLASGCPSRV